MLDQSRPPPPKVPPISHAGVRYEQVKNARRLGFEQVYFTSMTLKEAPAQLEITNEADERFVVDLASRQVRRGE